MGAGDVWSAEFRRTGRVVLPVRRKRLVIRSALVVLLLGVEPALSFTERLSAGGVRLGFGVLSVVLLVVSFVSISGWQFVTQRPMLTVDHEGIHYGKKSLPWSEVGTVGPCHGPRIFRVLPITPTNRWSSQLTLTEENVEDIPAFAAWLDELRADRALPRGTT